jgi:hypothetical protein
MANPFCILEVIMADKKKPNKEKKTPKYGNGKIGMGASTAIINEGAGI